MNSARECQLSQLDVAERYRVRAIRLWNLWARYRRSVADLDNPAGRLHNLLAAAKATDAGQAAGVVWGSILGANYPNELAVLLTRLAAVVDLPEKARQDLQSLGHGLGDSDDEELYFEPLSQAEAAFAGLHLKSPIRDFQSLITENVLFGLRAVSRELHRSKRSKPLPDGQALADLLGSTHDLLREVIDADVDEELRAFLIEHLNDMTEAIQEYRIVGREVLEAVVDRTTGNLLRRPDLRPVIQKAPLGKRFLELMKHLLVVLSVVNSSFDAIDHAFPALMPAPPLAAVQESNSPPSSASLPPGSSAP